MAQATTKDVHPRNRARLTAFVTIASWHVLGAAMVWWASSADAGQCQSRCGVDGHAFDGFMYLGQLAILIAFGLIAGVVAVIMAGYWWRHPILIGTGASAGALFVIGTDISLLLSK